MAKIAAKRLRQAKEQSEPIQQIKALPESFSELRDRQILAVQSAAYRCSLLIGPPGTGKTYTIGALVAHLLTRFPTSRILLVGPTNVAVDTALLSADDWLERLGRHDLRRKMKRLGAHFDPRKFIDRPHLLAEGIAAKAAEYLLLELKEPPRNKVAEYVHWKEKLAAARQELAADIELAANQARLVAVTLATAFRWHQSLKSAGIWHFTICDEASQVTGPAAMMAAALGQQIVFAGDPMQLAPIVRSSGKLERKILGQTAFDIFHEAPTVMLNEQSRMAAGICHVVGAIFYNGDLRVCSKAARDRSWLTARSSYFVNGRELPRVCFEEIEKPAVYSARYGGFIRFESAKMVEAVIDELSGSYIEQSDILVLTPFRAQRTLIRNFLKSRHPMVTVSTVHRAQGSERLVVVFDPVDATSSFLSGLDGDRLLNVALSRAKAHVILPFHKSDLTNPSLARARNIAAKLWQRPGAYARAFSFRTLA